MNFEGSSAFPIICDLFRSIDSETKWPNFSVARNETDSRDESSRNNSLILFNNQTSVRLVGGMWYSDTYTGLVQIRQPFAMYHSLPRTFVPRNGDSWGTVCETGVDVFAAMLICSEIGLVASSQVF